ncbi:hypothetical protein [Actibacterium mucosum]|nr:hypothetical protein [Actibacterium mucosum]
MSIEYLCVAGVYVVGFGTLFLALAKAIIALNHMDLLLFAMPFG